MTWPSLISLSSPLAISPCSPEAQTLLNCFQTLSIVYCLWTSSMLLHWPEMPWHLPCLSNQLKVILQMSPREVFWAPSSLMPHLYPYHTTMSSLRVRTILYSYLYFHISWCVRISQTNLELSNAFFPKKMFVLSDVNILCISASRKFLS